MPTIDELRRFAGADPDEDESVLGGCLAAAVAWYQESGVPPMEGNALYKYWCLSLATWFYDNRGLTGEKVTLPPYIVSSVHQLRPVDSEVAGT